MGQTSETAWRAGAIEAQKSMAGHPGDGAPGPESCGEGVGAGHSTPLMSVHGTFRTARRILEADDSRRQWLQLEEEQE